MSRREHEHGGGRPRANLAADLDARDVGQAEVEHDQVGALRRGEIDPGTPRGAFEDASVSGLQGVSDDAPDLRLVIDHKDGKPGHA
jgi:hypothetical protein